MCSALAGPTGFLWPWPRCSNGLPHRLGRAPWGENGSRVVLALRPKPPHPSLARTHMHFARKTSRCWVFLLRHAWPATCVRVVYNSSLCNHPGTHGLEPLQKCFGCTTPQLNCLTGTCTAHRSRPKFGLNHREFGGIGPKVVETIPSFPQSVSNTLQIWSKPRRLSSNTPRIWSKLTEVWSKWLEYGRTRTKLDPTRAEVGRHDSECGRDHTKFARKHIKLGPGLVATIEMRVQIWSNPPRFGRNHTGLGRDRDESGRNVAPPSSEQVGASRIGTIV